MANTRDTSAELGGKTSDPHRSTLPHGLEGLVGSQEPRPSIRNGQVGPSAPWPLQHHKGFVTSYVSTGAPLPMDHTPRVPCFFADSLRGDARTRSKLFPTAPGLGW